VRTNADGQTAEALAEDVRYLHAVWGSIARGIAEARLGDRIYEDLSLPLRVVRDLMRPSIEKVRVDSHESFEPHRPVRAPVHAQFGRADRTLPGRAADLRPVRGRGRDPEGAAQGGARSSPAATWSSTRPRR
jgi:hypothetical protein